MMRRLEAGEPRRKKEVGEDDEGVDRGEAAGGGGEEGEEGEQRVPIAVKEDKYQFGWLRLRKTR